MKCLVKELIKQKPKEVFFQIRRKQPNKNLQTCIFHPSFSTRSFRRNKWVAITATKGEQREESAQISSAMFAVFYVHCWLNNTLNASEWQPEEQARASAFFLKVKKGKANPPPSLNWPISYASHLLIWKLLGCSSPVLPHLQSCVVPTLNTSSAGGDVFPEPRGKGELRLLPTAVPLAPGMQHREQRSSFSTAREEEAETPTARPLNSQQGKRKGHTRPGAAGPQEGLTYHENPPWCWLEGSRSPVSLPNSRLYTAPTGSAHPVPPGSRLRSARLPPATHTWALLLLTCRFLA